MGDQHKALVIAGLVGSSGGSGGTTDYEALTNKPAINGVPLAGNKSTSDLGIVELWVGTAAEYEQQAANIPAGTPYIITDDDYTEPCYFDSTTGELYVNGVKILAVMTEAAYEALATKSNIWYATYPTPAVNASLNTQSSDPPIIEDEMRTEPEEEPIEEQPEEPTDDMR
jgi:hypothetical protein